MPLVPSRGGLPCERVSGRSLQPTMEGAVSGLSGPGPGVPDRHCSLRFQSGSWLCFLDRFAFDVRIILTFSPDKINKVQVGVDTK